MGAQRRQIFFLERTQVLKSLYRSLNVLIRWRFDSSIQNGRQTLTLEIGQHFDAQQQLLQWDAMYLGDWLAQHVVVMTMFCEKMDANTWHDTASSTATLARIRSRNPNRLKRFHVAVAVEVLLLLLASVDDKHAIIDRNRRFSYICAEDDLSPSRHLFEDQRLVLRRQRGVQRNKHKVTRPW